MPSPTAGWRSAIATLGAITGHRFGVPFRKRFERHAYIYRYGLALRDQHESAAREDGPHGDQGAAESEMKAGTRLYRLGEYVMGSSDLGLNSKSRGITGLETAIILIAFVVVASIFAFTVLSTGVFSAERSKETIYAGLQEAKSSLEPRGSVIAYSGGNGAGTPTSTVYKVTFVVGNSVSGAPVDLTPPYSTDETGIDPDFEATADYRTVISYTDRNQHMADVPWTIRFIGNASNDFLLESDAFRSALHQELRDVISRNLRFLVLGLV